MLRKVKDLGWKISRLRCDNGTGEYTSKTIQEVIEREGISFEPCPPDSHDKNGVAERMIRTINTLATAALLDAKLPMKFWGEAVNTVVYTKNRTPNSTLPNYVSPHEMLTGTRPNIMHLKRFGCASYRLLPKEQRDPSMGRYASHSRACALMGYVHSATKIWRLWDFELEKAINASNVIFREDLNATDVKEIAVFTAD